MLATKVGVSKGIQLKLKKQKKLDNEAKKRMEETNILLPSVSGHMEPENEMEMTFKITQDELKKHVEVGVADKIVKMPLSYGEYRVDTSRNGRYVLLGGHKGHIATYDTHKKKYDSLLNISESIRGVKFLQNHTMFAVAQRKYCYIYDQQGVELHCLRDATNTTHLDYLPYHFLLVSASERAHIRWVDVTSGQVAADHNTHLGASTAMAQCPNNAVIHLGHNNGQMTLWTPNMATPVAKLLAHRGAVCGIAVNAKHQMVTVGGDGLWRTWDMRNFRKLNDFGWSGIMPQPVDVSLSMTNTIALSAGPVVTIYKDPFSVSAKEVRGYTFKPYMKHHEAGEQFYSCKFAPFEDLLWCGSSSGIRSVLVPGAGLANFDGLQNNPFETTKQRQESEVRALLEKLPADTIVFNPRKIGGVDEAPRAVKVREAQQQRDAQEAAEETSKGKKKMRGKNKSGKREKKKQDAYQELVKRKATDRIQLEEAQRLDELDEDKKPAKRPRLDVTSDNLHDNQSEMNGEVDPNREKGLASSESHSSSLGRPHSQSVGMRALKQAARGFDPLTRFSDKKSWSLDGGKRKRK